MNKFSLIFLVFTLCLSTLQVRAQLPIPNLPIPNLPIPFPLPIPNLANLPGGDMLVQMGDTIGKTIQQGQDMLMNVMNFDTKALLGEEREVKEATLDLKEDEADVNRAQDSKTEEKEETEVKHDEQIVAVQEEDVNEMMADLKDEAEERDADVQDIKKDQFAFAKDHNAKADVERKRNEIINMNKRGAARKAKHDARQKEHGRRHSIIDPFISVMRQFHPLNLLRGKRSTMEVLVDAITGKQQH